MATLEIDSMTFFDQLLLDHLKKRAKNGEVHVIYREVANKVKCGRNTVYRSVNRLRDNGKLSLVSGNNRTGYTYRIGGM